MRACTLKTTDTRWSLTY